METQKYYYIERKSDENRVSFTTRIANEIQTMSAKIIHCAIDENVAIIEYENKEDAQ